MTERTVAEALADAFAAKGVKYIFGVPGGGSSLDIIEAAAVRNIEFVLTRTESAAVMMAAASAELSGALGVALMTKGPGSANATNGVAYASLERLPIIVLTDGFTQKEQTYITHQVFDQKAMLQPLTKGHSRLEGSSAAQDIETYVDLAMTSPRGPIHFELTSAAARAELSPDIADKGSDLPTPSLLAVDETALSKAKALLAKADRPVVIVGMEAREPSAANATRALVKMLNCPALTTYKAKGVISDQDPYFAGIFTGGTKEADCVNKADLIILSGIDPVEFIRQPWRYEAPVIDISDVKHPVHYLTPGAGLYGSISDHIAGLSSACEGSHWTEPEIADLRQDMHDRLQCESGAGINPQQVVELAFEEARSLETTPRITVDAGAHMFSAMEFWPCTAPCDVLISNGLATMAFALPAAIAGALHEPDRSVIAFTGDGGLLMCLGELLTAVQCNANITIVVFNDASLSLIDIKQQERQLPSRGMRWSRPDFSKMMEGMGGHGYNVETIQEYEQALAEALHVRGPALIDVAVDASGYSDQLRAMRG
jgi:acetolactate synthase I/II/III large subunit